MVKTLIIPDVHQNWKFVKDIIDIHYSSGDKIVFLGDYFDSCDPENNSIDETCILLRELYESKIDIDFLIGNHDISYYESIYNTRKNVGHIKPVKYYATGFSKKRATKISRYFSKGNCPFFEKLKLFSIVDDFVLVHAGFHPSHFKPFTSIHDNLQSWNAIMKELHETISTPFYSILGNVSEIRGGKYSLSSPIWLDFIHEFEPIDGMKQVVGHTGRHKTFSECIKGKNICLDNNQTTFAIIDDGKFLFYESLHKFDIIF